MINNIDSSKKVSSNKRWTDIEISNLKSYIEHSYLLSDIKQYLRDRSGDSILAQARKMGYGEQKLKNGDKGFVLGVKYRGKNKVKSTETNSDQTTVSVEENDTQKYRADIVPHNHGKEVTLTALNMLEAGSIQLSPDSVRDMSLLILQYRS
jgi:hypothetical protein